MSHFAEIDENGIVKRVIVAEQDFIDAEHEGLALKKIGSKHRIIII